MRVYPAQRKHLATSSDLPSESDVEEVCGISTDATVTPKTNDTNKCISQCCLNYNEAFQPVNIIALNTLCSKGRFFFYHSGINNFHG